MSGLSLPHPEKEPKWCGEGLKCCLASNYEPKKARKLAAREIGFEDTDAEEAGPLAGGRPSSAGSSLSLRLDDFYQATTPPPLAKVEVI